jgi:hypothetical protein
MNNPTSSPLVWAEAICLSEALYSVLTATQDLIFELAFVVIVGMMIHHKLLR